jgi:hypothetical protein
MFTTLLLAGPRLAILVWWLFNPARFKLAFSSGLWTILGTIFVPWTTIMYLIVFPGGVYGLDWLWIGLGIFADVAWYAGGGFGNRDRFGR